MKTTIARLFTLATLCTLTSTAAFAKDSKTINQTIDVTQGQMIRLDVPVGTIRIDTCQCDQISLQVKVEPKDSDWSFFSSSDVNVDEAQLDINTDSQGIKLSINEEDTKQKWTLTVPQMSALDVELGVGEVDVNAFNHSIEVDLGVGSVSVDVNRQNYSSIELETGVGDTGVHGFDGKVENSRAMVSSSSRYTSNGEHQITIDVGVGEAQVSFRQ